CNYNNDAANNALYGKLYNWYAVNDSRGLCPTGWHVPSDAEWTTLTDFLGGESVAGGKMKSTATLSAGGWESPNTGATDSSGFTGLPGGFRWSGGEFYALGTNGTWWSSSDAGSGLAWYCGVNSWSANAFRNAYNYRFGFAVRCVKDILTGGGSASLPTVSTTTAISITSTGATTGGNVTSDGGASVTARGVAYGTAHNPTTANSITSDGTGTGAFTSTLSGLTSSTLYYVRAYATNAVGTAYGNEESFTTLAPPRPCPGAPSLTDIDGKTYNTVQIGTQCWTQSNLKVSKYRNGNSISNITDQSAWSQTNTSNTGAWCNYNNSSANNTLYGKLYNWYAVNDSRGLCPTGWHVPLDAEWTTLTDFLGGESVAGGKMKSTATQPAAGGWDSPNTGATDSSGFTGLPGGYRDSDGGFNVLGSYGNWWSSSGAGSGVAWDRRLGHDGAGAFRGIFINRVGISVRCAKDVPATSLATIFTSSPTMLHMTGASTGGDITDSGGGTITNRGVAYGTSQNPTTANSTTSDGNGTGVFTSTLTGLTASTLYYVRAYATNSVGTAYGDEVSFTTLAPPQPCPGTPSFSDIDGNTYNTVQIGTQCWMQSNLKVSKYQNGNNISSITGNTAWSQTNSLMT
ncbi:MAG: FISUMP domain-containing protein, partial [Bacteroidota bacterium]